MKEGMYAERPLAKIHIGVIFHLRYIFFKNIYENWKSRQKF